MPAPVVEKAKEEKKVVVEKSEAAKETIIKEIHHVPGPKETVIKEIHHVPAPAQVAAKAAFSVDIPRPNQCEKELAILERELAEQKAIKIAEIEALHKKKIDCMKRSIAKAELAYVTS